MQILGKFGRTVWLTLCFSVFTLSVSTSLFAWGPQRQANTETNFPIGDFNKQGKLTNDTAKAAKVSISSFAAYFWGSNDINIGFSIARPTSSQLQWSGDVAPHRVGLAANWLPNKGRFRWASILGLGVGTGFYYNTETQQLEVGIKGTLRKW